MHLLVLLALCAPTLAQWDQELNVFNNYLRRYRSNNCGTDDYTREPRADGARWERGIVRYECQSGKRTPVECQVPSTGRWMREGDMEIDGNYGRGCIIDKDGYMRLATTHCVINGRGYHAGEEFDGPERKYWFRCVQVDELSVEYETAGCLTDDGQRVNVGETLDVFNLNTWYKCEKKESEAVAFCTRGCLDNGQRYNVGQEWSNSWDSSRRYRCERSQGRCDIVEINTDSFNRDPPVYVPPVVQTPAPYYPPPPAPYYPPREETYAEEPRWQPAQPQPAPAPVWQPSNDWDSYNVAAQGRPRDGHCTVWERGQFRFYLPNNSYTYANSDELSRPVYFLCEWDSYTSGYSTVKREVNDFDTRSTQLRESSPIYD